MQWQQHRVGGRKCRQSIQEWAFVDETQEKVYIRLSKGRVTTILGVHKDRVLQFKWCLGGSEMDYAVAGVPKSMQGEFSPPRKCIFLHTLISGMHVDHIDGDGLNNCSTNHRRTTAKENANNNKMSRRNRTGVNGV